MSQPDLYDQYMITSLPRTPDLKLSDKVVVPRISSVDTSIIDLGISKSVISSHITRPTPKLLWSYALNPTTIVDCMDVLVKDDLKYYVCGLTDRKKSRILVLETTSTLTEDGNANYSTSKELELKVSKSVIGVKFMTAELIVVLYADGSVESVKFVDDELTLTGNKHGSTQKGETIVYNTFIQDLEEDLLLVISNNKKNTIYRLISINPAKSIIEVTSSVVPLVQDAQYCYISGTLYQYTDKKINSLSISNFTITNTMSVEPIIDDEEPTSITAPAPDRILLGNSNKLYLLNVKFSSLLSTFTSSATSSHPIPDKVYINQVVPVKGNSTNSFISMAVYLNLKNKNNNVYLNVIDINVGLNKLSECLGKSIAKPKLALREVPELFETKETPQSDEIEEVYQFLKDAKESSDLNKWESILIPYLKNRKSWTSIKSSISKTSKKTDKVYEFKEFEDNLDRVVDINFVESVLDLIFTPSNPPNFVNEGFVPEYTLMYLLTNPLFPIKFTPGLVQLFNNTGNVTLLRQAVNTCPGIPCRDLLLQLVYDDDKETLVDLVNRVHGEFSRQEITSTFKEIFQSDAKSIDVVELIIKMIGLPGLNNWYIIEILIDVNGLFNWDMIDINALSEIIDQKIEGLTVNSYNLTLSNQVMLHNNISKKTKDVTAANSLLTLTSKSTSKKPLDDIDAQRKVPVYSIEKLE
ncbi:putative U3 snoRNP protein Utp8, partial [Candida maltosa Xu316]